MSDTIMDGMDLLNPDPEKIDIKQLLKRAAKVNRFGGRGKGKIDVLRHSYVVADIARQSAQFSLLRTNTAIAHAWLHDLHEVYTGEIPTPAKNAINLRAGNDVIGEVQHLLDRAIWESAGIRAPEHDLNGFLKTADNYALRAEAAFLELDISSSEPRNPSDIGLVIQANEMTTRDLVSLALADIQEAAGC